MGISAMGIRFKYFTLYYMKICSNQIFFRKKVKSSNLFRAFTLIELLIVIAIIGVLSAVIISSVATAKAKGRDARRIRDIQEINNAIQLYIAANDKAPDLGYPTCVDPSVSDSNCFATETLQNVIQNSWNVLANQLKPYISKLPRDPCGASCYMSNPNGILYAGYYSYEYQAPAMLKGFINNASITSSSYRIFAQNFETKVKSYGFGEGSW